jgi:hypothetical protein
MVAAFSALICQKLWSGTSCGSLICKLDTVLLASRTEAASYRIKLLFFLFKVVDINCYRADKDNEKKQ